MNSADSNMASDFFCSVESVEDGTVIKCDCQCLDCREVVIRESGSIDHESESAATPRSGSA